MARKLSVKNLPHLGGEVRDHPAQLVFAALHVFHLHPERIVPGLDLGVLLDGADVHVAEGADLIPHLDHLRPQRREAVELHTDFFRL